MNHASEASRLCGVLFSLFIQTPPPAPPTPPSPPSVCVIVCRGKLRHGRKLRLQTRAITMVTLSAPEHGPGPASLATEPSSSLSPSPSSSSSSSVPAGSPESLPKLEGIDVELNELMMSITTLKTNTSNPTSCGCALKVREDTTYDVLHVREKYPCVTHDLVQVEHRGVVVHNMVGTKGLSSAYSGNKDCVTKQENTTIYEKALRLHEGTMGEQCAAQGCKNVSTAEKSHSLCHVVLTADEINLYSNIARQYLQFRDGFKESPAPVPETTKPRKKKADSSDEDEALRPKKAAEKPVVAAATDESDSGVVVKKKNTSAEKVEGASKIKKSLKETQDSSAPADMTCFAVFACTAHKGTKFPFKVREKAPLFRMTLSFHLQLYIAPPSFCRQKSKASVASPLNNSISKR
eukprot:Rhum_TRINITY_DN14583_c14_g1::Rhum_TRINITY_DN14583_c14_g1_i2::g.101317::m.101317